MTKPMKPTAKYYYGTHKESARARGILFKFTYEEWVNWWEDNLGYNWMRKRGHRNGQYVMARKGDKGPYASWNVECITANQNHSDMAKHGTSTRGVRNPMARFTEDQICEIYLCGPEEVPFIARKYKIRRTYIHGIKRKRIWGHITKNLPPPRFRGYATGERHGCAKLTTEIVKKIYLAEGGLPQIAKQFGVLKGRVHSIKTGHNWASVTSCLGPAPRIRGRGTRTDLL